MQVLGLDPSWTCTGWALCGADGPVRVGSIKPGKKRFAGLMAALRDLEGLEVGFAALEQPGRHAALHGREVETVRGISLCAGAIAGWSARWGEPWLLEPVEWRRWWGLGGVARELGKAQAQALVRAQGWGERGPDEAEAILIGVGAARNRLLR